MLVLIARQAVTMGPRKAAGQCLHVHGLHYISPSEVPLPQASISRGSKDENEQVKKLSCILQQKWDLFISSYTAIGARSEQKQTAPLMQVHTAQVVLESELSCIGFSPGKLQFYPDKTPHSSQILTQHVTGRVSADGFKINKPYHSFDNH